MLLYTRVADVGHGQEPYGRISVNRVHERTRSWTGLKGNRTPRT